MSENITITVDDTTETVDLFVSSGTVNSVFSRTGTVVAVSGDYDTDEVTEATNLYYTDARVAANSAVALNTAKTGITAQQATDITTNNTKVTFPEAPNDGTQYARKSLGWEAVAGGVIVEDGSGIEQFTSENIRFDGFNFDIPTNKIIAIQALTVLDTGTVIVLNNPSGNYCNMASANTTLTYTTSLEVLGGFSRVLINAASEPVITGATKIVGSDFAASTDMYMTVWYNGVRVEFWFEAI